MTPFGELVQQWTDRTGRSIRHLAHLSGVDRTKIVAYTRDPGNRVITPEQATAISHAMQLPEAVVHEAVLRSRGYVLRDIDIPTRLRVLLSLLDGMDDRQITAVESTALALRDGR